MSPIAVDWTLFRSAGPFVTFDFDCLLSTGDQLFKFIVRVRYLGVEDLP